jgi:hypothetical protein
MQLGSRSLSFAISFLAALGCASSVRADNYELNIGVTDYATYTVKLAGFNGGNAFSGGAGNFGGSTLVDLTTSTTTSLSVMYCIDLTHNVVLGGQYTPTFVSNNGYVNDLDPSSIPNPAPIFALTNGAGVLTNAGQMEYLMDHFSTAVVGTGNSAEIMGLQLALWKLEYGNAFSVVSVNHGGDITAWRLRGRTPS